MKTRPTACTRNEKTREDPTLQRNQLPDRSSSKLLNKAVNVCFFNFVI